MPKKKALAAAAMPLQEQQTFQPDDASTSAAKNKRLAVLLTGPWLGFAIVRIERIEIGAQKGWRATIRA